LSPASGAEQGIDLYKTGEKMKLVSVMLPKEYLKGLHELVRSGMYPSRSAAIRAAVRDILKKELWGKRE